MKTQILALVAAAALTGGLAHAADGPTQAAPAALMNLDQAVAAAREKYPNAEVIEAEREHGDVWEVKLKDSDGRRHELYIDARSGEVRRDKRG